MKPSKPNRIEENNDFFDAAEVCEGLPNAQRAFAPSKHTENSIETVSERLDRLASKFLLQAETETNLNTATKAFDLAERALELSLKFKEERVTAPDDFIVGFDRPVRRSHLWIAYLTACQQQGFSPMLKSKFFLKVLDLGFRVKKSSGEFMVFPPERQKLLRIPNFELITELEID